ncbi:MAG: peroxiredoxin family protein [Fidelibacterota bacterium]
MLKKRTFLIGLIISILLLSCSRQELTNKNTENLPVRGKDYTIIYESNLTGPVKVVYVYDHWEPIYSAYHGPDKLFENVLNTGPDRATTVDMKKSGNQWQATITIPEEARLLSWYFTNGEKFDYNDRKTYTEYIYNENGKPVKNARFRNIDFLEMAKASPERIIAEIKTEIADYPKNYTSQIIYRRKIFENAETLEELNLELEKARKDYKLLSGKFGETDTLKQVLAAWLYDYGRNVYRPVQKLAKNSFDEFQEIMASVPFENQWGSMKSNYASMLANDNRQQENKQFMANIRGDFAPDFEFEAIDGKKGKLSDYRGNYTLLEFWSVGCGPCIAEIPNLKETLEKFESKGFDILGICLTRNMSDEKFKQFMQEKEITWTTVLEGEDSSISDLYKIYGVPTFFLIDPDGKVTNFGGEIRGDRLGKKLAELYRI